MDGVAVEYPENAGMEFLDGRIDAILEWYEKAIAENPEDAGAYAGAGQACVLLDRLPEAESYLQKAIELEGAGGEEYFYLGNVKFALGKYGEVTANYEKAETLGCKEEILREIYYQTGVISRLNGDTKSELTYLEKAGSMEVADEATKETLLRRMQIYLEMGDYAGAENQARQLQLLAPEEFRNYHLYARILIGRDQYDRAKEVLDDGEKYAGPGSDIQSRTDLCFDRVKLYGAVAGKQFGENAAVSYQSAVDVLEEFLGTPDLPLEVRTGAFFSKAELLLKLERFDDAMNCAGETGNREADNGRRDFIRMSCHVGKGEYEKAGSYVEKLKGSGNEYYVYYATYAEAYMAKKLAEKGVGESATVRRQYDIAIAYFKNRMFVRPKDVQAVMFRTRLYAEDGQFIRANELTKRPLPDGMKIELRRYIDKCRGELEGGD